MVFMALQEQLQNKANQYLLISITVFLSFLGCINKTTKPEIEKKIRSVPNITIVGSDSSFNFHKDTLFYLGKKFAGHIYSLYPNGDSLFSGSYLNGKEEGIFKKWYPNGQLVETRIYIDGNKEGFHQGWWKDGTKKFEYHFLNAEHHGELKEWGKNGQPYRFFHFSKGYEEGSQKMWWSNGAIRANYVIKNGKRYGLLGLKICSNPYDSVIKK
jgi:antitoxin component YwqK of YwqJK toxin-antitoxin module